MIFHKFIKISSLILRWIILAAIYFVLFVPIGLLSRSRLFDRNRATGKNDPYRVTANDNSLLTSPILVGDTSTIKYWIKFAKKQGYCLFAPVFMVLLFMLWMFEASSRREHRSGKIYTFF